MTEALYAQVHETLRRRIADGEWSVGQRLPSQSDLTEEFSVSAITVKRALDMLRDEGYVSRRPRIGTVVVSRSPGAEEAETRLPLIGYVVPGFDDAFGTQLLAGMLDASRHRAHVLVATSSGAAELEERLIEDQLESGIDALVLLPSSSQFIPPAVVSLVGQRFPLVIVDRTLTGMPVSTVTSDNVAGGRLAAEYLFGLGHHRLALVLSPNAISSLDERRRGFVAAHAAHHVKLEPTSVYDGVLSVVPGATTTAEDDVARLVAFLREHPDITGCVVTEYHSARILLRAARELGRSVPDELSIICFDAPPEFADAAMPFTHVEQDQHGIGTHALELVTAQLRERGVVAQDTIPVRIVEGRSTAAAPVR
ncbi:transcriptional regulator, GntR family with LacI sensor [Beutenbergia cavernae DSM 12333]|uniref:Transcriptional regulator, GntR family with LacI sensor n=1 Tax=Beutenbergia cavernae (strain ATCC BAA-8 / DSM 12333 / CCUG 43141 / JCM 11478 / NBRC 16432 / NCIMB 13614 / HKI 0122) TaxID=471853 RepID=C5C580_BEUC1|nr:GntR family transcriptional regulator [Beutenbergia cavernae]ACQ82220.1 transcriptional regulator, GntR family with LacI sensor [Beutenbergia cavernae DSM 12333]